MTADYFLTWYFFGWNVEKRKSWSVEERNSRWFIECVCWSVSLNWDALEQGMQNKCGTETCGVVCLTSLQHACTRISTQRYAMMQHCFTCTVCHTQKPHTSALFDLFHHDLNIFLVRKQISWSRLVWPQNDLNTKLNSLNMQHFSFLNSDYF